MELRAGASRGPLDGVVVADFSRVLAGPLAAMMLGDLGAEVIKIERPGLGDDTRSWGPPFADDGSATYYLSVNRNKRSVALDLTDEEQRAQARALAVSADVVVENFRAGTMERFGLEFLEGGAVGSGDLYEVVVRLDAVAGGRLLKRGEGKGHPRAQVIGGEQVNSHQVVDGRSVGVGDAVECISLAHGVGAGRRVGYDRRRLLFVGCYDLARDLSCIGEYQGKFGVIASDSRAGAGDAAMGIGTSTVFPVMAFSKMTVDRVGIMSG